MHTQWRDCKEWQKEGLSISTTSNEAAKMFDAILTQFMSSYQEPSIGGVEEAAKRMRNADPNFVLGEILLIGMNLMGTSQIERNSPELTEHLQRVKMLARNQQLTDREDLHLKAVCAFAKGEWSEALLFWEEILLNYPTDIMAIKLSRDTYFYLGRMEEGRDSLARLMPHWNENVPLYSYVLGHYAFALEETHFYDKAEKTARFALELNPMDSWSTHALNHVLEMTGRYDEGIKRMNETCAIWGNPDQYLSCHNYWHLAVFYLEKGDHDACLNIYDTQLITRAKKNGYMWNLADTSSLLHRLRMDGVPDVQIKDRLEDVVELYRPHIDDHILAFHDAHMLLTYSFSKDEHVLDTALASLEEFVRNGTGDSHNVLTDVGLPMGKAFRAFKEKSFKNAVELLYPVKYKLNSIGGSNAQRDLFQQFIIHSCIQSSTKKHSQVARHLISERKALKENSPLTDRLALLLKDEVRT